MFKSLLARLGAASRVAIPDDLWLAAVAHLPFVAPLDEVERARLRALSEELLAEKEMSAAGELELTAPMQVLVAVQACHHNSDAPGSLPVTRPTSRDQRGACTAAALGGPLRSLSIFDARPRNSSSVIMATI